MSAGHPFLDRYYDLLGAGDVDGFVALYADDAEIVRYDGVAEGHDAIAAYVREYLGRHPGFTLRSVDALRDADDVLMWDALVDTDSGVIQGTLDAVGVYPVTVSVSDGPEVASSFFYWIVSDAP